MVDQTWLGETNFDFVFTKERPPRATAIQVNGNDHYIVDTIVFSGLVGIQVNGAANYVGGLHVWFPWNGAGTFPDCCTGDYCSDAVAFDERGGMNRYVGCYVDCSVVQFHSPSLVVWDDGYVLGGVGMVIEGPTVDRLVITNTEFEGGTVVFVPNTTRGGVTSASAPLDDPSTAAVSVTDTVVKGNLFTVALDAGRASQASKQLSSASPLKLWQFDFCNELVFPNITRVRYSFTAAEGFPRAMARPAVGCRVAVELEQAAAGTMLVDVDSSLYIRGDASL